MLAVDYAVYRTVFIHRTPLPGLSLALAPALIPADELSTLFQQEILSERWRRVLIEDEPVNTLGAFLRAVESGSSEAITFDESSEKDMSAVESVPATSSTPASSLLRETLLTGLRALLDTARESSLNNQNGFGWRIGEHLYLVGKVMAHRLRKQPALEPYQTLIQQNASLYQLLVEQRIAVPVYFNAPVSKGSLE